MVYTHIHMHYKPHNRHIQTNPSNLAKLLNYLQGKNTFKKCLHEESCSEQMRSERFWKEDRIRAVTEFQTVGTGNLNQRRPEDLVFVLWTEKSHSLLNLRDRERW